MVDGKRKSKKINNIIDDILDEIREEFQSMTPDWFYDSPTFLREEQDFNEPEKGCLCPLVDLQDLADSYLLVVSLPGVKDKQGIELEADHRSLTIRAKIKTPVAIHDLGPYSHSYRTCDSFYRHIYLPDINSGSIEAKFIEGILELKIQKKRKKHRIPIR
jgi:HSP20 family molecular chaperone IbpA